MLGRYLESKEYNVYKDFDYFFKLALLKNYKLKSLYSNNKISEEEFNRLSKPRDYLYGEKEEDGVDVANDVMGNYPVSIEDEKTQIINRVSNLEYLREVNTTFDYCKNRCKLMDLRIKNFVNYPADYQKCFGDCLNVRTELFNSSKPNNSENKKTFVWLA